TRSGMLAHVLPTLPAIDAEIFYLSGRNQNDAPMPRQAFFGWEFEFVFSLPGMVQTALLGGGQDRDGPRGQALMRSRPSRSGRGPGAADGSLEGQHTGCGSRLA